MDRLIVLEVELGNYSGKDYGVLNSDECAYLKCILETLLTSNGGNYFCENIRDLDSNTNYVFGLQEDPNDGPQTFAEDASTNSIRTNLPTNICDNIGELNESERLELTMKLIHETLHAKFIEQMFQDTSFFPAEIHFIPSQSKLWNSIVESMFGESVTNNHHYLFFEHMVDIISIALWDLNNNQGNVMDYQYLAHVYINTQNMIDDSLDPPEEMDPNHWLLNSGFQDLDLSIYEENWNGILTEFGFSIGNCGND